MRVALLQVRQDAKSRSANIQSIVGAIDQAGNGTPPPDLLVLPGACDTGGGLAGARLTEAIMQVVRETVSFKAREWGVYIALGLHVRRGSAACPCAVLFDPDGDLVAQSVSPTGGDDTAAVGPIRFRSCAIGDIGVVTAATVGAGLDDTPGGGGGAVIVWPRAAAATAKGRRLAETNLTRLHDDSTGQRGGYWCVVAAAVSSDTRGGDRPSTFLRAPDGRILASVIEGEEAIVCAEVPIRPSLPEEMDRVLERDDHAG